MLVILYGLRSKLGVNLLIFFVEPRLDLQRQGRVSLQRDVCSRIISMFFCRAISFVDLLIDPCHVMDSRAKIIELCIDTLWHLTHFSCRAFVTLPGQRSSETPDVSM